MHIVKDLKENKEKALSLLFDRHADELYHLAFSLLKDQFESEDVIQEVFLKLWDYRARLDEDGDIKTLLYIITKRRCLNRMRIVHRKMKKQTLETVDQFCSSSMGAHLLHVKEIEQLEQEILSHLPEQQRKVYELSRKEGLTYEQISDELHISPHTVKNHIVQALKTVRRYFKKFGYYLFHLFLFFN